MTKDNELDEILKQLYLGEVNGRWAEQAPAVKETKQRLLAWRDSTIREPCMTNGINMTNTTELDKVGKFLIRFDRHWAFYDADYIVTTQRYKKARAEIMQLIQDHDKNVRDELIKALPDKHTGWSNFGKRNLPKPKLVPTDIVEGRENRVWKMSPSPDRWKLRSTTFQGIADAMAEQWSKP